MLDDSHDIKLRRSTQFDHFIKAFSGIGFARIEVHQDGSGRLVCRRFLGRAPQFTLQGMKLFIDILREIFEGVDEVSCHLMALG